MYKVGYVSGMFDILHIGHVNLLKYAKEVCEYLVVAVGTDDFIRQRKQREPFMPYEERCAIVESMRYVDKVVPGIGIDKLAAYDKYRFDVLIEGSDHITDPVYSEAENKLRELGVATLYYPRVLEVSSTGLRQKTDDVLVSQLTVHK